MPAHRFTRSASRQGLFVGLLLLLGLLLLWPIALTVQGAFEAPAGETLGERIASVFTHFTGDAGVLWDPVYREGLVKALAIAVCTTVLCIVITMPLSVLSARYDFFGKPLLSSLLLVPLILPPFVGAIGLKALMGRFGALNALLARVGLLDEDGAWIDWLGGQWLPDFYPFTQIDGRFVGIVIAEALHLYPILYLNVTAALANVDPALEEAAVNLGASRWTRFRRVTLPLILPGLFAGSTIVFIWSFTELGTPLMFDYSQVTPVQVFFGIQKMAADPRPYALVVVMLAVAVVLYLGGKAAFGRRGYAMQSKASIAASIIPLRGARSFAVAGLFALVTFAAVLPHLGVVITSLSDEGSWYRSVFPRDWTLKHYIGEHGALSHPLAVQSITNSLQYAAAAMVVCLVLGLAISYLTTRVRVRGGWVLDSLAMLPLAVPGLVMAFGYVAMTLQWPFDGAAPAWVRAGFGWLLPDAWVDGAPLRAISVVGESPNPFVLLVIAYAVRRLPYVVRSASAGLEQTSEQLEEAALNLGASRFTVMRRVVIPLIMANLIAGGILAFSLAMLEVSDSLVLAQRESDYPITKGIYSLTLRLGDGNYVASAMGVWGMLLLTVTLVGAGLLMGRKLGAIFRV